MKTKVETPNAPKAPGLLSQAIISNGFIFVAGQIHMTPEGKLIEGTTQEKLDQIMKNISSILTAANADLNNIVKVTIYVINMTVLDELNKIYPNYFLEPYPAREAVCVAALPLGASIEISMIAVKHD